LRERAETQSGSILTCEDLNREVEKLQQAMVQSYHLSCEEKLVKRKKPAKWWTSELTDLRKRLRRLFNKAKNHNSDEKWKQHAVMQKKYSKLLRRAKRIAWRRFCEEIQNVSETSKLNKVLASDVRTKLDVLRKQDGTFTKSPSETLDILIATHFPDAVNIENVENELMDNRYDENVLNLAIQIVTEEKVRWSLNSFSPYKSPGPDKIYPIMLQKGIEVIMSWLLNIYRASIVLKYIPVKWRYAKAIFIPKAGKSDYFDPKSFRTISLSSFLFKGLEKLMDAWMKETSLVVYPFEDNQHAYQKGKSTETALIELVERINNSLDTGEIALAVFLDIEGAFDRPNFDSIENSLLSKKVEEPVIGWIMSMLRNRYTTMELESSSKTVRSKKGFAQGGIMSSNLWNNLVDSLLRRLREKGFFTISYADDLCILIRGKFVNTVSEMMQNALKVVESWCREHQLSVNANKTEMMLFTTKTKIPVVNWPTLFGTQLELKDKVKYLGVTLDTKLNFKEHLNKRIETSTKLLWQCRRAIGRTWGLSPKMISWLYTCVIRPYLTYGCVVWWHRTELAVARNQLTKLQRLALVSTTGAMRSTPTAALETLLNIAPLHLQIEMEVKRTLCRLKLVLGRKINFGLGKRCKRNDKLLSEMPDFVDFTDTMKLKIIYDCNFQCIIPQRREWKIFRKQNENKNTITCFTDGSLKEDQAGAGALISDLSYTMSESLGKGTTVFQAEVYAILSIAYKLLTTDLKEKDILIFTDSQAAIKALKNPSVSSKLVEECKTKLNLLGKNNEVKLAWVPGHSGILENEIADILANEGADLSYIGPLPALGWNFEKFKTNLKMEMLKKHQELWLNIGTCKESKKFLDGPNKGRAKYMLGLKKRELTMLVGLITGHGPFEKHLCKMRRRTSALCQQCMEEEEETVEHFMRDCLAFERIRWETFNSDNPYGKEALKVKDFTRILRFIKRTGRFEWQQNNG
jgi:ribonuclease HI